jgi:hypothetical protein
VQLRYQEDPTKRRARRVKTDLATKVTKAVSDPIENSFANDNAENAKREAYLLAELVKNSKENPCNKHSRCYHCC